MLLTVSPEELTLPPGSEVTLRYQSWDDYEAILESRGNNAAVKVYFDGESQEISLMAPMPGHGRRIGTLSALIQALLQHQKRDWDVAHPITFKRPSTAGAEPDSSFYIQNWRSIAGKERIDLRQDPPPDLAIEVDITSLTHLGIYRVLGVPELWIYRDRALSIYVLSEENYKDSLASPTFPTVDVKSILPEYVELGWRTCTSRATREFDEFLRSLS